MRPFSHSVSQTYRRVPHISLVFREMWDAATPSLKPFGLIFASGSKGLNVVVSHISRKTSEMWGTRLRWQFKVMALSLLCTVSLFATACSKTEEAAPTEVYVQAGHPERGDISEQITADATLAPLAQAAISPKVTAPVKKFYVQRGSHVRAGQLLATLENRDLEAAALDNKGAYTAAQGTYDIATGATVPEDTVKAQLDLTQAI